MRRRRGGSDGFFLWGGREGGLRLSDAFLWSLLVWGVVGSVGNPARCIGCGGGKSLQGSWRGVAVCMGHWRLQQRCEHTGSTERA